MPSNDIDGSIIVILGDYEAREIYELLCDRNRFGRLTDIQKGVLRKIARDLDLVDPNCHSPPVSP